MKKIRKIKKDVNAGGHTTLIVIILIAIIAVGALYFMNGTGSSDYWEDPIDENDPSTGTFGQEIILEYADGTLQSVKPMVDGLTIWHDEKEVTAMEYNLKAQASGDSSTSITIDSSGYTVSCCTYTPLNPSICKNTHYFYGTTFPDTIKADGTWNNIESFYSGINEFFPSSLADGIWYVYFKPEGSLKYKVGSGSWESANLPKGLHLGFVKQTDSGGQIVINFDVDATGK